MLNNLLDRRDENFALWSPYEPAASPTLVIGEFQEGTPPTVANQRRFDLKPVTGLSGLWCVRAADCGLTDGRVYHYWFEVQDTFPGHTDPRIVVCDPMAFTTDWRVVAGSQPSAVVKFAAGKLVPCDPNGDAITEPKIGKMASLATNNQMVIYELPTAWTRQPMGSKGLYGCLNQESWLVLSIDPYLSIRVIATDAGT